MTPIKLPLAPDEPRRVPLERRLVESSYLRAIWRAVRAGDPRYAPSPAELREYEHLRGTR